MKKKQIALIFILSLIPFLFYFQHDGFVGADTYYFLQNLRDNAPIDAEFPMTKVLFSILPYEPLILKALLFFCLFISSLAVAKMGEIYNKKNGWLAGVFIFLAPMWTTSFFYLENTNLSYPLLFISLLLFQNGYRQGSTLILLSSISFLIAAGTLWGGAIIYGVGFSLLFSWFVLLCIFPIAYYPVQFISILRPDYRVAENLPFYSLFGFGFLIIGIWGAVPALQPMFIWLLLIAIVNMKFAILILPFLAVYFMNVFHRFRNKFKLLKAYLIMCVVIVSFVMGTGISQNEPTQNTWEAIEFAQQYSEQTGKKLMNDWSLGYWMEWKGLTPTAKAGHTEQDFSNSIVVHFKPTPQTNCEPVKEWEKIGVYDCE